MPAATQRRAGFGFRSAPRNLLAAEMRAQRLSFQVQEQSRQLAMLKAAVSNHLRWLPENVDAVELRQAMARLGLHSEERWPGLSWTWNEDNL
jgi:hypothetical protein